MWSSGVAVFKRNITRCFLQPGSPVCSTILKGIPPRAANEASYQAPKKKEKQKKNKAHIHFPPEVEPRMPS